MEPALTKITKIIKNIGEKNKNYDNYSLQCNNGIKMKLG